MLFSTLFCVFCLSACGGSAEKPGGSVVPELPRTSDDPSPNTTISIMFGNLNAKQLGYVGMSVDQAGNSYFIDTAQSTVLKMTPDGIVTRFAGVPNVSGSLDGPADLATFTFSIDSRIAVDRIGNVYVSYFGTLRKIAPDRKVTTLAFPQIDRISDLAIDSANNLYIADSWKHAVWQISASGSLATFAGSPGIAGDRDGIAFDALFDRLTAIVVDKKDQIYVIDGGALRKISQQREVSSLYGNVGNWRFTDPNNTRMKFGVATSLAADADNNIYVSYGPDTILKVSPNNMVSAFVGPEENRSDASPIYPRAMAFAPSGKLLVNTRFAIGQYGLDASALPSLATISIDGVGGAFTVNSLAIDKAGNFWIADFWYSSIRTINIANGSLATKYGVRNIEGTINQQGEVAYFRYPSMLTIDKDDNLYVVDDLAATRIRKISPNGKVSFIELGQYIAGMAVDNFGNLFVLQNTIFCGKEQPPCYATPIWKVSPNGVVTSLPGSEGFHVGIAIDKEGNILTSSKKHVIAKYDTAGKMTIIAGLLDNAGNKNGSSSNARFSSPRRLAVDSKGNIYIVDVDNKAIRKLTPSGYVSTVIDNATWSKSFPDVAFPGIAQMMFGSDDSFYFTVNGLAIAKVKW